MMTRDSLKLRVIDRLAKVLFERSTLVTPRPDNNYYKWCSGLRSALSSKIMYWLGFVITFWYLLFPKR